MQLENSDLELIPSARGQSHVPSGVLRGYSGGTPGVLRGYSGGTSGVLRGYIGGTLGVLSGYSSPSVVYTSICLYVDTSTWMGARATPWHRALDRENRLRA